MRAARDKGGSGSARLDSGERELEHIARERVRIFTGRKSAGAANHGRAGQGTPQQVHDHLGVAVFRKNARVDAALNARRRVRENLVDERQPGPLLSDLWQQEHALYVDIINTGVGRGTFQPFEPVEGLASHLLALEDGLVLHLIGHNDAFSSQSVIERLAGFAALALDHPNIAVMAGAPA